MTQTSSGNASFDLHELKTKFWESKYFVVITGEEYEEEVKKKIIFLSKLVDKIFYLGNLEPGFLLFRSHFFHITRYIRGSINNCIIDKCTVFFIWFYRYKILMGTNYQHRR